MIGRRMVAAGVVVAAVTAGGVAGAVIGIPGLSGASSTASLSTTAQSSAGERAGGHVRIGLRVGADRGLLDAAAKALKLSSTQDLLQKLSDGKTTIADIAKQQHVDINDVIDAMDAVAKADISDLVNNPLPTAPHFGGKGFDGRGFGGPIGGSGASIPAIPGVPGGPMIGGLGFGFRGAIGSSIDAVAKALGISSKDLLADLAKGQSIADIAKANHVDVDGLIKTLVSDATAKIDAEVKAGHLPKDIATKIESNLKQLITDVVNNTHPKGFGHFGGGRGFGHRDGAPGFEVPTAPPGPSN